MTIVDKLVEMLNEVNIDGQMTYPEKLIWLGALRELRHCAAGHCAVDVGMIAHPAEKWVKIPVVEADPELDPELDDLIEEVSDNHRAI